MANGDRAHGDGLHSGSTEEAREDKPADRSHMRVSACSYRLDDRGGARSGAEQR